MSTTRHISIAIVLLLVWGPLTGAHALSPPVAPTILNSGPGPRAGNVFVDFHLSGADGITHFNVYRGDAPGSETLYTTAYSDVTRFIDSGLAPHETHVYRISAVNGAGEGPQSDEVSVTAPTIPGPPMYEYSSPGPTRGSIHVQWWHGDAGGIDILSTRLYRGDPGGPLSLYRTFTADVNSFDDTGMLDGESHSYEIAVVNDVGEGIHSPTLTDRSWTLASAPRILWTQTGSQPGEVSLAWEQPSDTGGSGINGYVLRSGSSPDALNAVTRLDSDTWRWDDVGLPDDSTWYYRVSAINAIGEGAATDLIAIHTPSRPVAPTGLTADPSTDHGGVHLQWNEPARSDERLPVSSYRIYRGDAPESASFLAETGDTSYDDITAPPGSVAFYRVSAVNAVGEGPMSDAACARGFPAALPISLADVFRALAPLATSC